MNLEELRRFFGFAGSNPWERVILRGRFVLRGLSVGDRPANQQNRSEEKCAHHSPPWAKLPASPTFRRSWKLRPRFHRGPTISTTWTFARFHKLFCQFCSLYS